VYKITSILIAAMFLSFRDEMGEEFQVRMRW
jgi:hypothetical protein